MILRHQPRAARHRQRGAFGVLYALMLPVMLAMIGMAIDLSMVYARGHELQAVADGAALAAARALDGTKEGLTRAQNSARDTAEDSHWRFLDEQDFNWNNDALRFSASLSGPFRLASEISEAEAKDITFAMVDTAALEDIAGRVSIAFLKVVGVQGSIDLTRNAVAGRKESALGPLALCALSETEIGDRAVVASAEREVVELGFRRGVGYNLLNLNPGAETPINFVMNPVDFPPAANLPGHMDDEVVRPFVCSGMLPAPPIQKGSMIYVRSLFPASMFYELNSRLGSYSDSTCNVYGSPPDVNVRDFTGGYDLFWIPRGRPVETPLNGSALELKTGGRLVTIADAATVPAGTRPSHYGTLWSFARPLKVSGGEFAASDWDKLYPAVATATDTKLENKYTKPLPPYVANLSPHWKSPEPLYGNSRRRVLNVPLLRCPVTGSSAEVLGIGQFLMTTAATDTAIHAEFGGLVTYGTLTASAVLYE